jgi:hypothetical protein
MAWPIGPLACVVTLAVLFFASLVAFPLFAALVGAAAVVGWVLLR